MKFGASSDANAKRSQVVLNIFSSLTAQRMRDRAWKCVKRVVPLSVIVAMHILFFYALQSGLLHRVPVTEPKEVFAIFITANVSAPVPAPIKREAVAPKKVPLVKKSIAVQKMVTPIAPPSAQAITVAPLPTQSNESPATQANAAPPTAAIPAPPKTITGVEYIQQPQSVYPEMSKRFGEEGKVMLRVLVNEKGKPDRVEIQKSSGFKSLDEAARQAVLRAIFKPYIEDGKAVSVFAIVPIQFRLNN